MLLAAIILSVFMYYVETLPGMASQGTGDGAGATRAVEIILTVIFVAELLCRLTVGTLDPWNLLLIDVMFWVARPRRRRTRLWPRDPRSGVCNVHSDLPALRLAVHL